MANKWQHYLIWLFFLLFPNQMSKCLRAGTFVKTFCGFHSVNQLGSLDLSFFLCSTFFHLKKLTDGADFKWSRNGT
jgi:hypothetical protein